MNEIVCPPAGSRVYGKILLCLCVEMLKCTHIYIHRERETEIEIRWVAQSVDVLCVCVSFATKGNLSIHIWGRRWYNFRG